MKHRRPDDVIPSHILDFSHLWSASDGDKKRRYSIRVKMLAGRRRNTPFATVLSNHSGPNGPMSPVWTTRWTVRTGHSHAQLHVQAPRADDRRTQAAEQTPPNSLPRQKSTGDWKIRNTKFGATARLSEPSKGSSSRLHPGETDAPRSMSPTNSGDEWFRPPLAPPTER
jgi:hypothetical protein